MATDTYDSQVSEGKDYSDLATWYAQADAGDILDCYDSQDHTDDIDVGASTVSVTIRSAADCTTPFAGKADTGATFIPNASHDHTASTSGNEKAHFNCGDYIILANLNIEPQDMNSANDEYAVAVGNNSGGRIYNVVVDGSAGNSGAGDTHGIGSSRSDGVAFQCVVHSCSGYGFVSNLNDSVTGTSYVFKFVNCTAANNTSTGFKGAVYGTAANHEAGCWGCLAQGNGTDFDTSETWDHFGGCISSDTTAGTAYTASTGTKMLCASSITVANLGADYLCSAYTRTAYFATGDDPVGQNFHGSMPDSGMISSTYETTDIAGNARDTDSTSYWTPGASQSIDPDIGPCMRLTYDSGGAGSLPGGLNPDCSTLAEVLTETKKDLDALNNCVLVVDCYDSVVHDDSVTFEYTAGVGSYDSTAYVVIRSAPNCATPFDATDKDSGAVFSTSGVGATATFNIGEFPYLKFFQITVNGDNVNSDASNFYAWDISDADSDYAACVRCRVYDLTSSGSATCHGFYVSSLGVSETFWRCVASGCSGNGFSLASSTGALFCTSLNNTGFGFDATGAGSVYGCYANNNTAGDFDTGFDITDDGSDFNTSGDATAVGYSTTYTNTSLLVDAVGMIQFKNNLAQSEYDNLNGAFAGLLGYTDLYATSWVYGYDINGTAVANMSVVDGSVGTGANEGIVTFMPQVTWFIE